MVHCSPYSWVAIVILRFFYHLFIQCIVVVSIMGLELFSKNMCYSYYPKTSTQKQINGEFNKYHIRWNIGKSNIWQYSKGNILA